ncbi:protein transport protein bet1 [Oleoguttula sp. CCFEE 5521]
MASRFPQRDSRNSLFSSYDAQTRSRPTSASSAPPRTSSRNSPLPAYNSSPYGHDAHLNPEPSGGPAFSAYPGERHSGDGGFRPATPNRKGQYSGAVLDELESQNDEQVSVMMGKVRMLKDITVAIGDEIRDSSALAEKMNDGFEGAGRRLNGTMKRMLRMAESTGVGWRVWVGFFAFLIVLFWYVKLS